MFQFNLDFRKSSCFSSKNILSKVVLRYQVSMLTCPSVHLACPKIHFRIMRTVNHLLQVYVNRKFQKYISVSICHFHRACFKRSLFIAFKNDEWCHFVLRIGSPPFIPFYCVCFVFFYFSLFSCGVHYLLRYWGKFNNTYNKEVKLFLGS